MAGNKKGSATTSRTPGAHFENILSDRGRNSLRGGGGAQGDRVESGQHRRRGRERSSSRWLKGGENGGGEKRQRTG